MIIRFSARNFRSLYAEQVLSLIATNIEGGDIALFDVTPSKFKALPSAAIYGPNASGKSNLIKSALFFSRAVRNSQNTWSPTGRIDSQPFATAPPEEPTSFDLDFILDGRRYNYGFSVNSTSILSEWLYTFPTTKKQLVFTRDKLDKFTYGRGLSGPKKIVESQVRDNSLFLSAAAQAGHHLLTAIYKFISEWMFVTDKDIVGRAAAYVCAQTSLGESIKKLVGGADLGIVSMEYVKKETSEEAKMRNAAIAKTLPASMQTEFAEFIKDEMVVSLTHRGLNGKEFVLKGEEESKGTLTYIAVLTAAVIALNAGAPLFIDEIDESLHPSLTREIIRLFGSKEINKDGAQLIFNTHDSNLLDLDLLRRDQIWFTEKDSNGATHIYPLTDFKPRFSENIEKGYLQGRYGAIPFLGDFTRLLRENLDVA